MTKPRVHNRTAHEKEIMVKTMLDAGNSEHWVASALDIPRTTVQKIKARIEGNAELTEIYKANKANYLAKLQAKNLNLHDLILDSITEDDVKGMTINEKSKLARDSAVNAGIFFDKEAMERSKGVDNVNKVLEMISRIKELEKGGG